jgi:hypothetical protein
MSNIRATASSATRLTPIGLDISTMQGLAMAYKIGAGECLADSRVLLADSFSDRTGHFIITLHAIELALKAFLIARGYTETDLKGRSFGHDLEKLYAAAKASGLKLDTPNADELIAWTNEWHSTGVRIRYEFVEQRTLPLCETLVPLASEILQKIIWTNRVTLLKPDGGIFEVHTVAMGTDPYIYTRDLIERDAKNGLPAREYIIERDGVRTKATAEEVLARAQLAAE